MSIEWAPQKVSPEKRSSSQRATLRESDSAPFRTTKSAMADPFPARAALTILLRARAVDQADNMSSATLSTVHPATPRTFSDLNADMLEDILIKMPPRDAFESRLACTGLYAAATSESLWSAWLESLLESSGQSFYTPDSSKHACEQYFDAVSHLATARPQAEAHLFLSYNQKNEQGVYVYENLAKLGEVVGAGQVNANFVPAAPIEMPQPAVVAMELVRLFSTAMVKGTGKPVDKFRRAGEILNIGQSSLRKLADRIPTDLRTPAKKARAARELAAPFPVASPVRQSLPPAPLRVAGTSSAPNESTRYFKRKADKLETENLQLRDDNRVLRQRLQETEGLLEKERRMRAQDAAARSREVFRLTSRISELEKLVSERAQMCIGANWSVPRISWSRSACALAMARSASPS